MSKRPSVELPVGKRPSLMPSGDRKASTIGKSSFSDDGKTHLKTLLSRPPPCKTSALTPYGQLFLCVIGSVISLAICIWLAFFSRNIPALPRFGIASGAALCAVFFGLLAYNSKRRITHPPMPEPLPDMSQRRSTIGGRPTAKRSTASALTESHGQPTQVLVVNNRE